MAARTLLPHVPATVEAGIAEFHAQHPGLKFAPVVALIAAYREEACIAEVVDAVPAEACGLRVDTLVVVDGDEDATARISAEHGAKVLVLKQNCGHGVALRVGYRLAAECGAEVVVTLDGDGQWDPRETETVLGPVAAGEADFVIGSRVLGAARTNDAVRQAGVHFFAALVRFLTGVPVTDTSSGFRALRVEVANQVPQRQVQYQTSELLIASIYAGYRVAERPITMQPRLAGESKKGHNFTYAFRYLRVVMGTWWRESRRARRRGLRLTWRGRLAETRAAGAEA